MWSRAFSVASSLALLAACGDDAGSGTGGGGGSTASSSTTSTTSTAAATIGASSSSSGPGTGGGGSGTGGEGGSGGTGGTGGAGGGGGSGLIWEPCSYSPDGAAEATCARPLVPLDWDTPEGETIELSVKRVPAERQPSRGQLWLLQGGPGVAVAALEGTYTETYREAAPDLDLYLLDHRGVGASTKLECPGFDPIPATTQPLSTPELRAATATCVAELEATWGEGLRFFSAAAAGRDLGELIEITRDTASDEQVFVAAVSYGSRWAHRYLQQFPEQPTGVVFDSALDETTDYYQFGANLNDATRSILEACGDDAFCSGKLGADPWAKLDEVLDRVRDEGHCPTEEGLGLPDYQALLATLATLGAESSSLVAAALYRLDRCNGEDADLLLGLRAALVLPDAIAEDLVSAALHFNVVHSELGGPPPADLAALEASLTVSNVQMVAYAGAYDLWPVYDPSPWLGESARTDAPLLILSGTYDGNAPSSVAAAFAARFDGPAQTFVVVPGGHHTVVLNSPLADGSHCGSRLVEAFLGAPTAALDTSCAGEVVPMDFEGVGFPGASDAWD